MHTHSFAPSLSVAAAAHRLVQSRWPYPLCRTILAFALGEGELEKEKSRESKEPSVKEEEWVFSSGTTGLAEVKVWSVCLSCLPSPAPHSERKG